MNLFSFVRTSSFFLGFCLVTGSAAMGLSGAPGQAKRAPVFSRTDKSSFDKIDISLIRLQSSQPCNLEFIWSAGQTTELTWTIEAFIGPFQALREPVDPPVSIVINKESRAVTVSLIAEGNRFKQYYDPSAAGPRGVSILDSATGLLWEVRIRVSLPRGIDIDTAQFEGWTHFADEPAVGNQMDTPGFATDEEAQSHALKRAEEISRQEDAAENLKRYRQLLRNKRNDPKR